VTTNGDVVKMKKQLNVAVLGKFPDDDCSDKKILEGATE
jgi:hypothetical protein